jgi:uncharacterized protein (TIGR03435 family)
MREPDDHELLGEFTRAGSETAFAKLVERYVNLIYSAAFRFTNNVDHAEEITQAVFIILARKAGNISSRVVLSGWLYQVARLTAANFVKGEIRRQRRQQEAYMQSTLEQSESQEWSTVAPVLDEAMGSLGKTDRDAVVLRYFENKSAAEIGAALRMNEDTARRRVNRAVEKLRRFFVRRNVRLSSDVLTGTISIHAVKAAPSALARTASTAAAAKGAAGSSTLTLVKGALKVMAWTKAKTAIVVGIGVLIAAGATTVSVKKYKAYQAYLAARDSWRVPRITSQMVAEAMPQARILPTQFKLPVYGSITDGRGKWAGVNAQVRVMAQISYSWPPGRIVFSGEEPTNRYDFITTVVQDPAGALRKELKETVGFVGHTETRDTDAFVLRVRNPNAPGLNQHMPGSPMNAIYDTRGRITSKGLRISPMVSSGEWGFTRYLQIYLKMPVVDETGLEGFYDIDFKWKELGQADPDHNEMKQVMLDQLGFELVPTNMPIEMLVVEKVK